MHLSKWPLQCLIFGPAVLALLLIMGSVSILSSGAHFIHGWLWDTLKEIGPAVAGVWVLAAGLLTLTASGIAVRETRRENGEAAERNRVSVIVACECDLKSYEYRIENLQLEVQLREHVQGMKEGSPWAHIFRRSLPDDWFRLSSQNPVAVAELGEIVAVQYFSLAAQARNLSGRLLWLNSSGENNRKDANFWLKYHEDTYRVLLDVMKRCAEVKLRLSELRTPVQQSGRPAWLGLKSNEASVRRGSND